MAVPTFRGAGAWTFSAASVVTPTTLTPVKHGSTVNGDLLVLITECLGTAPTVATPTGWTFVGGGNSADSKGGKIWCFARQATGAADDAPSVVWSGLATGTSGYSCGAGILSYSGLAPLPDANVTTSDANAADTTMTAVTTNTNNSMVIGSAIKCDPESGSVTISNFNERVDTVTTSGAGHMFAVADLLLPTAGSSGTATVDWTDATFARNFTFTMALKAVTEIRGGGDYGYNEEALKLIQGTGGGFFATLDSITGVTDLAYGHTSSAQGGLTPGGYTTDNPILGKTSATTFDNTDDRVQTSSAYNDAWQGNYRTFFGWARRAATTDEDQLWSSPGSGTTQPQITMPSGTTTMRAMPAGSGGVTVNWTSALASIGTNWFFFALVFDNVANSISFYLNGTLVSTQSATWTWPTTSEPKFGARATTTAVLNGQAYGIGIAHGALTADDIARLYSYATAPPIGATAQSGGSLSLFTPTQTPVPLQSADAVSTASNAPLTAKTGIPLQQADAVSSSATAFTAKTGIPLQTAAAISTASTAFTAQTRITLQTAAAVSTGSASFKALTYVPLQSAAAVTTASATLDAPQIVLIQSAAAVTTSAAALSAKTTITLQQVNAGSDVATLLLTAKAGIPLATAAAVSTASLIFTVPAGIPLATAAAVSTASASVTARGIIALQGAPAITTSSLALTAPTKQFLPPGADSVDGAWTNSDNGTALYTYVSDQADPTYIQSEFEPANSSCRMKLAGGLTPVAGTQKLRTRYQADGIAHAVSLTIRLYQGGGDVLGAGTLVDTFNHTSLPTSLTTVEDTITGTITNYGNLYVELEAD